MKNPYWDGKVHKAVKSVISSNLAPWREGKGRAIQARRPKAEIEALREERYPEQFQNGYRPILTRLKRVARVVGCNFGKVFAAR
jgi:hypothetical protein